MLYLVFLNLFHIQFLTFEYFLTFLLFDSVFTTQLPKILMTVESWKIFSIK